MSSSNDQYPTMGGRISPSAVTPHYGTTVPNAATDIESARNTRCATGVRFITTIHGILNVIIIVSQSICFFIKEFIRILDFTCVCYYKCGCS
jgi:hypothetical protein